ncbi:hypothetical protein BH10PSE19_BH10PSE19_16300 [soil metagenome]
MFNMTRGQISLVVTRGTKQTVTPITDTSLARRFAAAVTSNPAAKNHLIRSMFPEALTGLSLTNTLHKTATQHNNDTATVSAKLLSGISGLYHSGSRTLAFANASSRCLPTETVTVADTVPPVKSWGYGGKNG